MKATKAKKYFTIFIVMIICIAMVFGIAACTPTIKESEVDVSGEDTANIKNGNFERASGTTYPLTPESWTASPGQTGGSSATPTVKATASARRCFGRSKAAAKSCFRRRRFRTILRSFTASRSSSIRSFSAICRAFVPATRTSAATSPNCENASRSSAVARSARMFSNTSGTRNAFPSRRNSLLDAITIQLKTCNF